VKSRVELVKELMPVLGFERNEPNNSESGARSLTIIRLVLWESQVCFISYASANTAKIDKNRLTSGSRRVPTTPTPGSAITAKIDFCRPRPT
jgi:hypothetical protein